MLLALLRAILGPTIIDRLISINAVSSLVSVFILLMAFYKEDFGFLDVAFVFMICAFVGGLSILKALTPGDWESKMPVLKNFDLDEEVELSNDKNIG